MSPPPPLLEEPYRAAAVTPGTVRYYGWLFAASEARDALLGVFALATEWHALGAPVTEPAVALAKLGWWQQEIERLVAGHPVHPITRFLKALPGAEQVSFAPLERTLGTIACELGGMSPAGSGPLDSLTGLEAHAEALIGEPLRLVAALVQACAPSSAALSASIASLAIGQHLAARAAALGEDRAEERGRLRARAAERLESVPGSLPAAERAAQRHLLVMAALERQHLYAHERDGSHASRVVLLRDLFTAWQAARRAAAPR